MRMISSFDDFCVHQTSNPIAHPASSDRNYYDRYWFQGADRDGKFCFEIGWGVYPNRYVMDGHLSISSGDHQYSFHASRRAPDDRADTVIGPFRLQVEKALRQLRVRLEPHGETELECDLLFRAVSAATEEPKNCRHEGSRLIMENSRFTQFGTWEGFIKISGQRITCNPAQVLGIRDKSWGVRPVGEPEGGAPSPQGAAPRVYWCWNPINFGDVCTQFGSFEEPDGTPTQLSASQAPLYKQLQDIPQGHEPQHQEMRDIRHTIRWRKGTRYPEEMQLQLHSPQDGEQQLQMKTGRILLMKGIGYGHPQWGHGIWQGEEKIGGESWRLADQNPLDPSNIHAHHLVQAQMGQRRGLGLLETVVFGRHERSGFKELLDGAP